MPPLKDLTGQKFGRLTVIQRGPNGIQPNGASYTQWWVKCDCGQTPPFLVRGSSLTYKNSRTKSCGCLHRETAAALGHANKKYNTYDLSGEFGIGYTSKGETFYFDLEDYDKIKDYCWYLDGQGRVMTNDPATRKHIFMHRLIMGVDDPKEQIDHIKHDTRDNRKSYLRIVSNSQNNMNKSFQSNNTSGKIGVYFSNNKQKWVPEIMINKKKIYLGVYDTFDEAVAARKEAEEKYFGKYSYENSMKYQEEDNNI